MWSTGEGNGKPLQYSCLENPMNSMQRQNDRIPKEELPRSVGAQYATGDQWRNNSRKSEGMEPSRNERTKMDWNGWIKLRWPLHLLLWAGIPQKKTKESEMQYLDAISKTTEWSLFVSKAIHSISQLSKSMPQPVTLKKLKLNSSMKT